MHKITAEAAHLVWVLRKIFLRVLMILINLRRSLWRASRQETITTARWSCGLRFWRLHETVCH
jgi:hypothetical protein